jgi:uncharacterized membrane protein
MKYVKSATIGLIAVVACVALFTEAMRIFFYYDGRYLMGRFWFTTLPLILFIFAIGFYLTLRKVSSPGLSVSDFGPRQFCIMI